jgi:hypothetical protein
MTGRKLQQAGEGVARKWKTTRRKLQQAGARGMKTSEEELHGSGKDDTEEITKRN